MAVVTDEDEGKLNIFLSFLSLTMNTRYQDIELLYYFPSHSMVWTYWMSHHEQFDWCTVTGWEQQPRIYKMYVRFTNVAGLYTRCQAPVILSVQSYGYEPMVSWALENKEANRFEDLVQSVRECLGVRSVRTDIPISGFHCSCITWLFVRLFSGRQIAGNTTTWG